MAIGYYMVFGWPKKQPTKPEDLQNTFKTFKELCKKHKLTLVFYGGPYGVPEPLLYVIKGKVTDWEKASTDMSYWAQTPLEKTRTVLVWDYE